MPDLTAVQNTVRQEAEQTRGLITAEAREIKSAAAKEAKKTRELLVELFRLLATNDLSQSTLLKLRTQYDLESSEEDGEES